MTGAHSRVTGTLRLALSVWLMGSAVWTLADPRQAVQTQGLPMDTVLPLAGLSFAVGMFLLTGFMSRVMGLLLVGMGMWQIASFGFPHGVVPSVLIAAGVYFALRGGGAWAMDIYVQKMQDRVRQRAINSPESS
jgi:uncharacterized membrane protein YphA (DoxX/SURF4 family)